MLGIAGLQPWEIEFILAAAEQWVALNRSGAAKRDDRLRGLYFVGAGTHPGAGVPGVVNSAKATAGLMIDDLGGRGA